MDSLTLRQYIKGISDIPDADIDILSGCVQLREMHKGNAVLREGEVCRAVYLVKSGYLRTWYNKEGLVVNVNFTFEGQFTTDFKSVKSREGSAFTIEAGEDATVWVFDLDKIPGSFRSGPQFALFIRRLAVRLLLVSEEQSNLFRLYNPAERYHYIEAHHPELLQRVPLSQIASYLGMARETLSRIRAKGG